jgi:hypothetical protein
MGIPLFLICGTPKAGPPGVSSEISGTAIGFSFKPSITNLITPSRIDKWVPGSTGGYFRNCLKKKPVLSSRNRPFLQIIIDDPVEKYAPKEGAGYGSKVLENKE